MEAVEAPGEDIPGLGEGEGMVETEGNGGDGLALEAGDFGEAVLGVVFRAKAVQTN